MSIYIATKTDRIKSTSRYHGHDGNTNLFTQEQLDILASIMYVKKVSAGSFLFWEGDTANSIYWVRKGLIKLRKSTKDGKDLLLSIVQSNDLIADIDPWDTAHRYSAEAINEVEVGVISRMQLEQLMRKNGELSYSFAMWMSHIQRQTETKLRDLLMNSKYNALASTLIRLSNSFGIMQQEGILLDIKLTNSEFAELIGTTREGVNRILSTMKAEGIIEQTEGGMLRIVSLDKLRSLAGCPECPACPQQICRI